ncbi:hypothetical protein AWT69_004958 [Pseudomonas putida]|nr:hypothetical protein AWT69_004958 [Pseudomonas putida]
MAASIITRHYCPIPFSLGFGLSLQRRPVGRAITITNRLACRILVERVKSHPLLINQPAILLISLMMSRRHPRHCQRSAKGHPAQRMSCHWNHHCFGVGLNVHTAFATP